MSKNVASNSDKEIMEESAKESLNLDSNDGKKEPDLRTVEEKFIDAINHDDDEHDVIELTNDLLVEYIEQGLDVNIRSNKFRNDQKCETTALLSAMEWRENTNIDILLKNGADINCIDGSGFNIIETCLMGHNPWYQDEYKECEKSLKLIMPYKPRLMVHEWILDECCKKYIKKSKYIRNLLDKCVKIKDDPGMEAHRDANND